jgi:secretion/DNA translocation related TadE-like protein
MSGRPEPDRGSATVWVVSLAGVLALLGLAVVLTGAAAVARHRAGAAADLAALAGAQHAVTGAGDPCGTARRLAEANAARLVRCRAGPDAVVAVTVAVPVRLGRLGVHEATARARAGPVALPVGLGTGG